ncbi:hypothetical protein, partial [Janthinobacterium sp.]|uniref:hypothetical protein n=1 Tax=Janthinobacterium sp. TaxID=1871054 RepID=UPI0025BC454E
TEFRMTTASGQERVMNVKFYPHEVKGKRNGYWIGFACDVTEDRRYHASIVRNRRALRALALVNAAISRARSRSELHKLVCQSLVEGDGYAAAWIGLRDIGPVAKIRVTAHAATATRAIAVASHAAAIAHMHAAAARHALRCLMHATAGHVPCGTGTGSLDGGLVRVRHAQAWPRHVVAAVSGGNVRLHIPLDRHGLHGRHGGHAFGGTGCRRFFRFSGAHGLSPRLPASSLWHGDQARN